MNKTEKLIWVILFIIHGSFFVYQLTNSPVYLTDSEDYLIAAANIRNHTTLYCQLLSEPLSTEAFTRRPPFYPLLIAAITGIRNSTTGILLLQNLLSLLNFVLVFRFFRNYFPEYRKKLIYLLPFLLFNLAQVIYANLIMAEMLLQTLVLLFFLSGYEFLKTKKAGPFLKAACLLIAGIFTKPVLVYFSGIFFLGGLFCFFRTHRKRLVLFGALPLLAVGSYNTWNYARTGYFHFSSIKEINLLYYNTALFLQKNYSLAYSDSVVTAIEQKAALQPDFAGQQQYISSESNKILFSEIFRYGIFHSKGILNFFLDPGRFDLYTYFGLQTQDQAGLLHYFNSEGYSGILNYLKQQPVFLVMLLLLTALFNVIRTIAFFWFISNRKFDLNLRLLMGLIVFYFAFITGPLGASRFLVPVFPIILISVPFFFSILQAKWSNRKTA